MKVLLKTIAVTLTMMAGTAMMLTACDKAHARGMLFAQFEPKAYDAYENLTNEIIAADIIRNDETETKIINNIDREVSEKLYNN